MTKTTSALAVLLALLTALVVSALAFDVSADTQDLRGRGSTGRTVDLTPAPPPPQPSPAPTPTPTPSPSSGGITSVTVGEVDTGGNIGGNVTTGNESIDIHEVNIGPTNPPPPPPPAASPSPAPTPPLPSCDGRTRTDCATQTRVR